MSSTKHIGHQVIAMMDRLGASPITRNYHLFYVCIADSNPALRRAVRSLGRYPSQHQLDQIIEEYCPEAVDSNMVRRHENAVLRAIDELALRLQSEQSEMSNFNSAIERVSGALARSGEEGLNSDVIRKVVGAIEHAGSRRVASGQRTLEQMDKERSEVQALRDELVKVRKMANTDVLTGLANRRHFDDRLASAIGQPSGIALVLADIDHFKRINDTHGHAFGDHVLKLVAATIVRSLRPGTFIARTGGEEFAILLPQAQAQAVAAVAEKARQSVERLKIHNGKAEVRCTVSLGAAISSSADTPGQLYEAADAALYRAKDGGRNRFVIDDPDADDLSTERYRLYIR